MTVLPDLEKQLIDAAARATGVQPQRRRPARFAANRLAGGPAVGVFAATVLAIAVGAVMLLRAHNQPGATATVSQRQQLIDILGVLRRPQTSADLNPRLLSQLRRPGGFLAALRWDPDLPLIRLATTTPWGAKVFLIPMKPTTRTTRQTLERKFPRLPKQLLTNMPARPARGETLAVFSIGRTSGGGDCCATVASIEAGGGPAIETARPPHGPGYTRLTSIVPDGVARVVFVLPGQRRTAESRTPIYSRPLIVAALVRGNVAAVEVPRQCCNGPIPAIWYGANGRVLKRIGNPHLAGRLTPSPKPSLTFIKPSR